MRTLIELLRSFPRHGSRTAIVYEDGYRCHRIDYRELSERVLRVAAWLEEHGVQAHDRVVLWGGPPTVWVPVFWAAVARRVQIVALDAASSAAFVSRVGDQVGARQVVVDHARQTEMATTARLSSFESLESLLRAPGASLQTRLEDLGAEVTPDDVVQIVFTSGTTGTPRGIVVRHRHLCANLAPFETAVRRFEWLRRLVPPLRIVDLLPLSHLFGQVLGVELPALLGAVAVFPASPHPGAVVGTCRRHRVHVLVAVPKQLQVLRQHLEQGSGHGVVPATSPREDRPEPPAGVARTLLRGLRHLGLHRRLGGWCRLLVAGGARTDPEVETWWRARGFLFVQGYGLTETSPVVAVNHPLRTAPGSVGRSLPGVEVRLAPDGEILVRGANVVDEVLEGGSLRRIERPDGWLHTGDLGALDTEGRLYVRGRKKDLIVVGSGLNVVPEDVERVLRAHPAVLDAVVLGHQGAGGEVVHAVVRWREPGADPQAVLRAVNAQLEPHQRLREIHTWTGGDFPRTPSTGKVRRHAVSEWLQRRTAAPSDAGRRDAGDDLAEDATSRVLRAVARVAERPVEAIEGSTLLEADLGFTSLERIELLDELERTFGVELDEEDLASARSVGDLLARVARPAVAAARPVVGVRRTRGVGGGSRGEREANLAAVPSTPTASRPAGARTRLPRWRHALPVRAARFIVREAVLLPLWHAVFPFEVCGRERLQGLETPFLIAANHTSHLDTMAIVAALPRRWRGRVAPAMSQEYLHAYFEPAGHPRRERVLRGMQYVLACGLLNAFPLPRWMPGTATILRYVGEQVDAGACPLVFPEGHRSADGRLQPFAPGIGLMALRLAVPVVPVHLTGTREALPRAARVPRRRPITVRFGEPVHPVPTESPRTVTARVRERIARLEAEGFSVRG